MAKSCYMCEGLGTTDEHVPPRGLFPKPGDALDGKDLRKNLITVPSCEPHNTHKAEDDEYFVFVLIACHLANMVGQHQAETKLKRAVERAPALIKKFVPSSQNVRIKDAQGLLETVQVPLDIGRFESVAEKIGRALHFHHFGEKWAYELVVFSNFVAYFGGKDSAAANDQMASINSMSTQFFLGTKPVGANVEVFSYNVRTDEKGRRGIRANFYGEAQITYLFNPEH